MKDLKKICENWHSKNCVDVMVNANCCENKFISSLYSNYLTKRYNYNFLKHCIKTKYSYYYWIPLSHYIETYK